MNDWKLVPVEPTREMICAGQDEEFTPDVYRRMLAAAPQPPALGDVDTRAWMDTSGAVTTMPSYGKKLMQIESKAIELVDRAHVARLQAEVEIATGNHEEAVRIGISYQKERDQLQAELVSANADKHAYAQNAIDLQAEVERLSEVEDAYKSLENMVDLISKAVGDDTGHMWMKVQSAFLREIPAYKVRNAELEGLLRKQAEHIATLADNTLSYSSGIGSLLKTKEVNDAAYAALAHQQVVNAALAEGKGVV